MDEPSRDVVLPAAVARPRTSRRGRWVGALIALLGLAAVGWLAWHLTHRPKPAMPGMAAGGPPGGPGGPGGGPGAGGGRGGAASTVGIGVARRAAIPVLIDALGTVTSRAVVTVRPQVSGVLTQVLFTEGQMVKKGEVLAVIDPQPFQILLDQARGARLRDEAQLDAARVTLERFRTLLAQDSIARQDVDTQAALVKQLEGTVAIDRANEGTARLNLGYSRIVAPVSGRVGLRPVDAGNTVGTGDTTGVAVITQIAPIDVEFSVPEDRVLPIQTRLASGAALPVKVLDRARTRTLGDGMFSTLDNLVDTQTGTVKAKARFANDAGLLFPNQFVNVQLLLRTIENAIVVPVTALRTGPNGDFVYVLRDDRTVTLRLVKRGESTTDSVVITSGLEAGERVVTEGGDRLKDGARVQLGADRPARAASGAASGAGGRASGPDAGASAARHGRRASAAAAATDGAPAAAP